MIEKTDRDILGAFETHRPHSDSAHAAEVLRISEGGIDPDEAYYRRRIAKIRGEAPKPRTVTEGELPLAKRPFEATRRHAAEEAVDRALEKLVAHISAKRDSTRWPDAVADEIREAAYVEMAKVSRYESDRLDGVAIALEKALTMDGSQAAREAANGLNASSGAEATEADILRAVKGIK